MVLSKKAAKGIYHTVKGKGKAEKADAADKSKAEDGKDLTASGTATPDPAAPVPVTPGAPTTDEPDVAADAANPTGGTDGPEGESDDTAKPDSLEDDEDDNDNEADDGPTGGIEDPPATDGAALPEAFRAVETDLGAAQVDGPPLTGTEGPPVTPGLNATASPEGLATASPELAAALLAAKKAEELGVKPPAAAPGADPEKPDASGTAHKPPHH